MFHIKYIRILWSFHRVWNPFCALEYHPGIDNLLVRINHSTKEQKSFTIIFKMRSESGVYVRIQSKYTNINLYPAQYTIPILNSPFVELFPFKIIESFQFSGCFKVTKLNCVYLFIYKCVPHVKPLYIHRPNAVTAQRQLNRVLNYSYNAYITSQLFIRLSTIFAIIQSSRKTFCILLIFQMTKREYRSVDKIKRNNSKSVRYKLIIVAHFISSKKT